MECGRRRYHMGNFVHRSRIDAGIVARELDDAEGVIIDFGI
jgi:hypothetical protein